MSPDSRGCHCLSTFLAATLGAGHHSMLSPLHATTLQAFPHHHFTHCSSTLLTATLGRGDHSPRCCHCSSTLLAATLSAGTIPRCHRSSTGTSAHRFIFTIPDSISHAFVTITLFHNHATTFPRKCYIMYCSSTLLTVILGAGDRFPRGCHCSCSLLAARLPFHVVTARPQVPAPIVSYPSVPDSISCALVTLPQPRPFLKGAMPKDGGLSKGVQITYGSRRHTRKPITQKTTANKTLKQIAKEKEIHAYKISG